MPRGSCFLVLTVASLLAAAPAAGQDSNVVAPPPVSRPDTVGPEQLRDFSLGNNNRQNQAEQPVNVDELPPISVPRPQPTAPRPTQVSPGVAAPTPQTLPIQRAPDAARPNLTQQPAPAATTTATAPGSSVTVGLPPAGSASAGGEPTGFTPAPQSGLEPAPIFPTTPLSDGQGVNWWPWLGAALAVLLAGLFLFWRQRQRSEERMDLGRLAFAGAGPMAGEVPQPQPRPAPRPAPRPTATPAPQPLRPRAEVPPAAPVPAPGLAPASPKGVGIVSSRLRGWVDLDIAIRQAVLTEEELQLQVDVIVLNSGTAPARDVAVEAVIVNAGEGQEAELATYFGRAAPEQRAIEMLAPLDQVPLSTTVRISRSAFREYAVGEHRVLVPIVALNASYRAGSAAGRTSAAFLVGTGRSGAEKLGPLRTDEGPRTYRGVTQRRLELGVRR